MQDRNNAMSILFATLQIKSSLEKKKLQVKFVNTFQRRKNIMNRKIIFAAAALAAVVTLGTVAGNTVYAADGVSTHCAYMFS